MFQQIIQQSKQINLLLKILQIIFDSYLKMMKNICSFFFSILNYFFNFFFFFFFLNRKYFEHKTDPKKLNPQFVETWNTIQDPWCQLCQTMVNLKGEKPKGLTFDLFLILLLFLILNISKQLQRKKTSCAR